MVQASAALAARLRFTTKSVGRGFYRGNRVGSMGSHTKDGGYLIDWRKTRSYNVPTEWSDFHLTPYVTREINPKQEPDIEDQYDAVGLFSDSEENVLDSTPASILNEDNNKLKKALMEHFTSWRRASPDEFSQRLEEEQSLEQRKSKEAKRSDEK